MQQNKKENNGLVLFICKANVGRSQIAEGIYNKIHGGGSISLAGNEARKRKYKSKPLKDIVHFLKLRKSLDISNQRISYLKDIPDNILSKIRIVYFLYDPNNESSCDNPCKKDGLSPYVYFKKVRVPIFIYPIDDPFDIGKGGYNFIYQEIYNLISNLK